MEDSLTIIIAIALSAVLMFVFPLMKISQDSDSVSQLSVQNATTEFVEKVCSVGKMTLDDYDKFIQTINSTGNTYTVAILIQKLDENPGKKTAISSQTKIGENIYYNEYTKQVIDKLKDDEKEVLKEGDIVTVMVANSNTTIAQTLDNFLYNGGDNSVAIAGSHSRMVTSNGN